MRRIILTVFCMMLILSAYGFTIQSLEDGRYWERMELDSGDVVNTEQLPYDTTWYSITSYSTGSIKYIVEYDTIHPSDGDWDTVYVNIAQVGKIRISVSLTEPSVLTYVDGIFVYVNDTTGINPFNITYNQTLMLDDLEGEIRRLIIWTAGDVYQVTIEQYRREYQNYIDIISMRDEGNPIPAAIPKP